MGMNKNTVYQVGQAFRRTNDIDIKQEDKDAIVKIGIGHLAVGNINEFMLAMTTLSKIETTADLSNRLDQVTQILNGLVNNKQSLTDGTSG